MAHRQEQFESALKRAIGKLLVEGLADPRLTGMISVTQVDAAPDRRSALVKVSVLPESEAVLTLRGLRHAAGHLQSMLGKHLALRRVPRLRFELDESLKAQARVLGAIREAVEADRSARPGPPDQPVGPEDEGTPL